MELTDADSEARREPLSETLEFIESIEGVCVHNLAVLPSIGGNIFIGIAGVGEWTLVTRGPRPGFFPEATADRVDFALICEEWVLHKLLDPQSEIDLQKYIDAQVFYTEGDFSVFERLLMLAQQTGGSLLDIRTKN